MKNVKIAKGLIVDLELFPVKRVYTKEVEVKDATGQVMADDKGNKVLVKETRVCFSNGKKDELEMVVFSDTFANEELAEKFLMEMN